MAPEDDHFVTSCKGFREEIANLCADVITLKEETQAVQPEAGQNRGEEMSNLMLAFRNLEDAAFRLGKAIQAHTTGVSPLGGPTTPRTLRKLAESPANNSQTAGAAQN